MFLFSFCFFLSCIPIEQRTLICAYKKIDNENLVSAGTKKQFGILKDLMNRSDVDIIVNACDAR